jgi:hypothetical protein
LAQSREKLKSAANKMTDILKSASSDPEFRRYLEGNVDVDNRLSKEDSAFYYSWAKELGITTIKVRSQVFQIFITQTYKLATK